jgi:hypothetical protein
MSRRIPRAILASSLAGLLLGAVVGAASADELEDYLAEAEEASYAGRQATWCSFLGETEFNVVSIEHAGNLLMVDNAGSEQVVGAGRNSIRGGSGIALSGWSTVPLSDRYSVGAEENSQRLERNAVVVDVTEDDLLRARIWFDTATGAVLGSEVYDGSGELYRLSWLLDFDPNPRKIYEMMQDDGSTFDVVTAADVEDLPDSVAGYERVDTYTGPDDSLHAFYADGLFSFSLFVIDGELEVSLFETAETMKVAGAEYKWLLTPSDLWIEWSGGGHTYVLVGDLPPDHLEQVLVDLPGPSQANLLMRLWRGLFG